MEMLLSIGQHVTMFFASCRRLLPIGLLAGFVLTACARRSVPLERQLCNCELLTDTDELSTVRVEACVASTGIQAEAKDCAQSGAPANVQSCRCEPLAGSACSARSCKVYAKP